MLKLAPLRAVQVSGCSFALVPEAGVLKDVGVAVRRNRVLIRRTMNLVLPLVGWLLRLPSRPRVR